MKIDSIEDTLYFLAGLDVAHTSTVLSEGGTTGQAGTVISPTLNRLNATNWTDNQWFNFVCGLIKVAAGQTPPTPFPEYIEGYNFAIIPPDTVYARGTANEIVWTGVDEIILQVGTLDGSTITYKTYLINLTNLTFTFLYDGQIQAPKYYIAAHGSTNAQGTNPAINDFVSRIDDQFFIAGKESYISGIRSIIAQSNGTTRTVALRYDTGVSEMYSTSLHNCLLCGDIDHPFTTTMYKVVSGAVINPTVVESSWLNDGKLPVYTHLYINGTYNEAFPVPCGNHTLVYIKETVVGPGYVTWTYVGYEFENCDIRFSDETDIQLVGTFTGKVLRHDVNQDCARWAFHYGSNSLAMCFNDSMGRLEFPQFIQTADTVTLGDNKGLNFIGYIPPGTAYGESLWTPGTYGLVVVRTAAGDATYKLMCDTGELVYDHAGGIESPMSSLMWNVGYYYSSANQYPIMDSVEVSDNNYCAIVKQPYVQNGNTLHRYHLATFSLTSTGISQITLNYSYSDSIIAQSLSVIEGYLLVIQENAVLLPCYSISGNTPTFYKSVWMPSVRCDTYTARRPQGLWADGDRLYAFVDALQIGVDAGGNSIYLNNAIFIFTNAHLTLDGTYGLLTAQFTGHYFADVTFDVALHRIGSACFTRKEILNHTEDLFTHTITLSVY